MWCDTEIPELEPDICVACGIDPPCESCVPLEDEPDERYFASACDAGACGHDHANDVGVSDRHNR